MAHADIDDLAALVLEPDDARADVQEHVHSCPACAQTLEALAYVEQGRARGKVVIAIDEAGR